MNKTKIEYVDYSWNVLTGCLHGCSYCYARKIAERFPQAFPRGFQPNIRRERLGEPCTIRKSKRILVCSMGDLFGKWVSDIFIKDVIEIARLRAPQHTYLFLTKNPVRYKEFEFPDNCWLGVSKAVKDSCAEVAMMASTFNKKNIKFISYEPLLENVFQEEDAKFFDWAIVGAQTNPTKQPERQWIGRIIYGFHEQGKPVFLKDNLGLLKKIQEYPSIEVLKRVK